MFGESIDAYIDGELSEDETEKFLTLASECTSCDLLLQDYTSLKITMGRLVTVQVSDDFDISMRHMIRAENRHMQDPLYRLKLFVEEKWKTFALAPAAAVIVLGLVFLRPDLHFIDGLRVETAKTEQNTQDTTLLTGDFDNENEVVRYVLDTVKKGEAENGIFLNEHNLMQQASTAGMNINVISF
jgi:hypothetical protein